MPTPAPSPRGRRAVSLTSAAAFAAARLFCTQPSAREVSGAGADSFESSRVRHFLATLAEREQHTLLSFRDSAQRQVCAR